MGPIHGYIIDLSSFLTHCLLFLQNSTILNLRPPRAEDRYEAEVYHVTMQYNVPAISFQDTLMQIGERHGDWLKHLNFMSDGMNLKWSWWCAMFLGIMEKCIPKTSIFLHEEILSWLNHTIKNALRRRDTVLKKSGCSANFRSARNEVTSMFHKIKFLYFKSLNPKQF